MDCWRWGLFCVVAGGLGAAGCLTEPAYACQSNESCVSDSVQGECHFQTNTCRYPATDCPSAFKDASGACFPVDDNTSTGPAATTTTTAAETTSSSTGTSSSTTSGQTTESVEDDDMSTGSETTASSAADTGGSSSSSGGPTGCADNLENLTGLGNVSASTVFSGFPAGQAVDGDLTTSWFSTGPEGGGSGPSIFTWQAAQERCIGRVIIENNEMNQEPDFRSGYGFESVTVRVFSARFEVLFDETFQLPGTPDPRVVAEVGAVTGSRIVLEWNGHENSSCGGFSELQILGS